MPHAKSLRPDVDLTPSASVVSRTERGLSWRDARREVLSELVDELESADRAIASAQARRIRAIEGVRALAAGAVPGLDPADGSVDPSDAVRVSEVRSQQIYAHRAVVVEISCALRTPEATTTGLVHDAQALVERHPRTMAALADGEISYVHTGVILDSTVTLDPDDCRALESRLVERAKVSTVASLRRFARRERERTHPRPLIERHRDRLEERRVEIEPARDGMMWLHQYLPAVQATAIYNRLTDTAVTLQVAGESRTLSQLRVDVLSALLLDDDAARAASEITGRGACPVVDTGATDTTSPTRATSITDGSTDAADSLRPAGSTPSADRADSARGIETTGATGATGTSGITAATASPHAVGRTDVTRADDPSARGTGQSLRGVRPVVAVTVPVMTLLGLSEEPGQLEGYGPVDADTARELAARAPSFTRILTHPETAVVLSVGRTKYAVPADLKTWLRLRDETCRFPGCRRRAARCDIDHIIPWQLGGATDHDNLIHLCRHHHRLKHMTGWTVERTTDRTAARGETEGGETEEDGAEEGGAESGTARGTRCSADTSVRSAFVRPDTVTWTSPAGRTYTDHPALPRTVNIPTPADARMVRPPARNEHQPARNEHQAHATAVPSRATVRAAGAPLTPTFPDEPPF